MFKRISLNEECSKFKTTKYRNPSLKLMVNVCGHTLCEICVYLQFVKGKAAKKPSEKEERIHFRKGC